MQHFYKLPKAKTTDQKYNAELDRKLRRIFTSNYYLPKLLQIFGCLLAPGLAANYERTAGRSGTHTSGDANVASDGDGRGCGGGRDGDGDCDGGGSRVCGGDGGGVCRCVGDSVVGGHVI